MKDFNFKIHSTGEEVAVSIVSVEEMSELFGKKASRPLIAGCGYVTAFLTENILSDLQEMYKDNAVALESIKSAKVGHAVTVLSDIDDRMTKENSEANFLHEIGHVVCGHAKKSAEDGNSVKTIRVADCNIIDEDEMEIEADAYAASFVGYHRVLAGLNAAVRCSAQVIVNLLGSVTFDDVHEPMINGLRTTARYQELLKYTEGY